MTKQSHPIISDTFNELNYSAIRHAAELCALRPDRHELDVMNMAIGNVSCPMHPAMQERLKNIAAPGSSFADGQVRYTSTAGTQESRDAFLNIIAASGFSTEGLQCQITTGASQAMELMILGVCGPAGTTERPLMVINPIYANYLEFAKRFDRHVVSVTRALRDDGTYVLPDLNDIEDAIKTHQPGALLILPADNPTGQLMRQDMLVDLARLCVRHNLWLVSDEAYRELHYLPLPPTSIWGLDETQVPGITGRRISIESVSKVWNACGLRIGALVTDNPVFLDKSVIENMPGLGSSALGQYIAGALAHESHAALQQWFETQRQYYKPMITDFVQTLRESIPGIIVSHPDASLYSVVDFRNLFDASTSAMDFIRYCAEEGRVEMEGYARAFTLLAAPMQGFLPPEHQHDAHHQIRLAYVLPPEQFAMVPAVLKSLLSDYLRRLQRMG